MLVAEPCSQASRTSQGPANPTLGTRWSLVTLPMWHFTIELMAFSSWSRPSDRRYWAVSAWEHDPRSDAKRACWQVALSIASATHSLAPGLHIRCRVQLDTARLRSSTADPAFPKSCIKVAISPNQLR